MARVSSDDPLVLGQRLYGLRGRAGILDSRFLFYALQTERVQSDLLGRSTGTTVFGIRQSALRQVVISAPAIGEQRAIAEVLGALDDKIAANDRALDLGDQFCASQVRGAAMQGEPMTLREVLVLNYGKSLSASTRVPGPVTVFGSGGPTGSHDTPLVDRPGVVVGRKGTVGSVYWADGPHFPIDTTYFVQATGTWTDEILYYVLKSMPLADMNSDSAVPGLNREEAYAQQVRVPKADKCCPLSEKLRSTFAWMGALRSESRSLTATRDQILPLLMSGRVHVKDAEKIVEGVA